MVFGDFCRSRARVEVHPKSVPFKKRSLFPQTEAWTYPMTFISRLANLLPFINCVLRHLL
jgi:hypothetical protein